MAKQAQESMPQFLVARSASHRKMSTSEAFSIPHELDTVTNLLNEPIESLAHGSDLIQSAALQAAKYIFDLSLQTEAESKYSIDELLSSLNPLQKPQTRSQVRSGVPVPQTSSTKSFKPTPLSSLFIENMEADQVWMQLDLRAQTVCDLLEYALETGKSEEEMSGEEEGEGEDKEDDNDKLQRITEALRKGGDIDLEGLQMEFDEEMDVEDESTEESGESEDAGGDTGEDREDIVHLRSDESQSDGEASNTLFDFIKTSAMSKKRKRADHGLNDDFFDLDAFNAESERAEAKSSSRGHLADGSDDSEDENMSVDLFAPTQDEADEGAGDIFYLDFFAPPKNASSHLQSKAGAPSDRGGRVRFHDEVRVKKIKAKGKSYPLSLLHGMGSLDDDDGEDEDDYEDDYEEEGGWAGQLQSGDELMERDEELDEMDEDEAGEDGFSSHSQASEDSGNWTMERLENDLFADDDEPAVDGVDMTTHEKRQAALRDQIAQLEAENVAKKDWTLLGEADSRSRPQNSLLEEDLEFERVMKAVPVISEEVVQGLEQRIKARILDNRFDDVVLIRPLENKPFLPSRIIELQDTKSTQSLAQIYEKDYLASQGGIGNERDEKLKKEHEEIEKEWEKICNKLDALCNAHFVPKQPKAVISTVSNVATASVESALPTVKATSSILTPEEIFNPASSETRSRSELTPTEKRALRAKERKAKKKQRDILEKSLDKAARTTKGIGGLKREKQAALNSIVKTGKGVTVMGKQGKGLPSSKKRQKP